MSENNSPAWFLRKSSKAAKLQPETRLYSGRHAPQKHEHEWVASPDMHPMRYRVTWRENRRMWWPQSLTDRGWVWVDGEIVWAAAEIARLAGLTKPEDSK